MLTFGVSELIWHRYSHNCSVSLKEKKESFEMKTIYW